MDGLSVITKIDESFLFLVPALWAIGFFMKQTPGVPSWCIPWVLIALGIAAAAFIRGFNPESLAQGVLAAAAAVLAYETYKQSVEGFLKGGED